MVQEYVFASTFHRMFQRHISDSSLFSCSSGKVFCLIEVHHGNVKLMIVQCKTKLLAEVNFAVCEVCTTTARPTWTLWLEKIIPEKKDTWGTIWGSSGQRIGRTFWRTSRLMEKVTSTRLLNKRKSLRHLKYTLRISQDLKGHLRHHQMCLELPQKVPPIRNQNGTSGVFILSKIYCTLWNLNKPYIIFRLAPELFLVNQYSLSLSV